MPPIINRSLTARINSVNGQRLFWEITITETKEGCIKYETVYWNEKTLREESKGYIYNEEPATDGAFQSKILFKKNFLCYTTD